MNTVYLLEHTYEWKSDHGEKRYETKTLGVFYSEEEAKKKAVDYYITLPGFKDFSRECFNIDEYNLNEKEWVEGFI